MTIAQLKRDIQNKNLVGVMTYRYGNDIPERLTGERKITRSNSVGIFFQNKDGRESEMRLPRAGLLEYTGNTLKVYNAGLRELTSKERATLDAWEEKEKTYNPYQETYWIQKAFFRERDMMHLLGYETVRGMKYDYSSGMVRDERIRGDLILAYDIKEV